MGSRPDLGIERVAVLGAGSWGTAFAKVLADSGREVVLWARRGDVAAEVTERRRNSEYLPDIELPEAVSATTDARAALDGAQSVVLAVPSQTLRENLTGWASLLPRDATVASLAKGVELGTLKRMSQVISEVAGIGLDRVAVITGPNMAREIAMEQPAATVIACTDQNRAVRLQQACSTPYFRPYTNHDVVGCEVGGACKNVIALACGMASGLGYGINTRATLITRGLAETTRLATALGGDQLTLAGLAGLGDLVATCSSELSRNRTFGERLGRGETVAQAQGAAHGQVAEGVKSCSSIRALAQHHRLEMPITDVVHRVCHDGLEPKATVAELLGREHKHEWT